jgi:hypothetical protein
VRGLYCLNPQPCRAEISGGRLLAIISQAGVGRQEQINFKFMNIKRFLKADLKTQVLYLRDLILQRPNLKNGLILETKIETDLRGDYELGALPKVVLKEDCQYEEFLSTGELQRREDRDKMACVSFSVDNNIEIIINYLLWLEKQGRATQNQIDILNVYRAFSLIKDGEANFSDRYIAKLSGTSIRGNSMQVVANTIRHYGFIPEDKWPYVNDWDEYYKPVPQELIKLGQQFAEYIDISYEWVNPDQFNDTKKFGPIQTAVCANSQWYGEGVIPRNEGQLNHAVVNTGFLNLQYDKIGDSYDPFKKKVAWDFNLGRGLLFTITLKKKFSNQPEIDKWIAKGYRFVMFPDLHGELFQLSEVGLHKVSPQEWNDKYVLEMQTDKKLVLLPNEEYDKLIN